MKLRLQIFLARAGLAPSRRKAETLIKASKILVNKKVAKLGDKIDPSVDIVEFEGHKIELVKKKLYLMLNKPAGYLVAKSDIRGRPLAYDLLKEPSLKGEKLTELEQQTLFNVGRLDLDTEGLLLFTNDGEFALRLTHPRYRIRKVYIAKVSGRITDAAIKKLEKGVWIKVVEKGKVVEHYKSAPAKVRVLGRGQEYSVLVIKIAEGRKREVRRMCEATSHPIISLKRIQIGNLKLDLPIAGWRFLREKEVTL